MENINYHDFLNMCRTCMVDIDLKPIEDKTIIDTLEIISDKNYKTNDELPQQICGSCIKKILDINNFIKQFRLSEANFKVCLANFKNECPSATIDPGDKPVEVYVVEPPKIKEEKTDITVDSKPNKSSVNFESIINDMRKEFDVPPADNDPLNVNGTDSLKTVNFPGKTVKPVETIGSSSDEIDEPSTDETSNQSTQSNRCDICDKIFTTRSSLTRHKRLHSDDKSFKCEKVFSKHEQKHISVKRHECDVCNKCFARIEQLKRHKRTHSDVKVYQCEVCNKTFSNSSGLVKHKRLHTELTRKKQSKKK